MNSFWDDICFRAKDVADAAAQKTGELYELSKYKIESVRINNEMKELYAELGEAVYSMMKSGYENRDLLEGLAEEIDELALRLDAVTEKIDEMKKLSTCPACGHKNSPENFYCSRCGTKLASGFDDDYADEETMDETNKLDFDGE